MKEEGAVDIIYRTLKSTGLIHDEGPDKDGILKRQHRNASVCLILESLELLYHAEKT